MAIRPNKNRLPALAAVLLLPAAAWTASTAPPAPLELLDAALSAPTVSYHGRMMITEWSGKQTRAEEVEVSYSPTNRYRWEFLRPDGTASRLAISDGTNEQILLINPGKTINGESVRNATKLMFPEREKELLLKNYRLAVSGPDTVAGRKAWVLTLDPLVAGKPHQQLWFDQNGLVILGIKRYLPKRPFATLSRFTRFELVAALPDELFAINKTSTAAGPGEMVPDFLSIDELEKATGRETDMPDTLPGGFAFESADYFEVGKDTVRHLRYTDGLAVLSLFLTDRPVRLPADGAGLNARLSPPGSMRISSMGKVFSWKRGRQHYTLLSDVSRDLLGRIADGAIPPQTARKQPAHAPAAEPQPEGRIRWTKLAGSVESADLPGNRLWVKAKTGKSRDFILTPGSEIARDKKPAGLSDVKPGDKVTLLRYNSATREIKKIELAPAGSRWR